MILGAVNWDTAAAVVIACGTLTAGIIKAIQWAKNAIIRELRRELRPNGLDTDLAGDILKRTEGEVMAVRAELQEHVDKDSIDKANIWEALHRRRATWIGRLVARLGR